MEIAVVTEGIAEGTSRRQPWMFYREQLDARGYHLRVFSGEAVADAFSRPYDAMMLYVWLDWRNRQHFEPRRTMRMLERYSTYRADYPRTKQIIVNHTDMSRRPFAHIYWRPGDLVLYRTPARDRGRLHPFPADAIWAYECIWGDAVFDPSSPSSHLAGFIGTSSGPAGYRERVARATAQVGIGECADSRPYSIEEYHERLASCRIAVCPRGWGEQSLRHWDAWLSGKPVLTDRDCDSVEMIPGVELRAGEHYLVYDEPEEIPDIVRHWTEPSREADLAAIAERGRRAALGYDGLSRMTAFFDRVMAG